MDGEGEDVVGRRLLLGDAPVILLERSGTREEGDEESEGGGMGDEAEVEAEGGAKEEGNLKIGSAIDVQFVVQPRFGLSFRRFVRKVFNN